MAEEPTASSPLDAIDLQSFTDEELQRLSQLIISERERRMGLEPGPEEPVELPWASACVARPPCATPPVRCCWQCAGGVG